MPVQSLNDDNFAEVALRAGTRVLVDFWAPGCAPCVGISRHLEQRSAELAGKITIVKVNADEAIETAAAYGVRGLPTLILLKDGKRLETQLGTLTGAKLDALLANWCAR